MTTTDQQAVTVARGRVTYRAAIHECIRTHREQGDMIGAHAISAMYSRPRSEHRKFADYQTQAVRDVCLNAVSFAEQESAA
jgi:hypothetical protein